MKNFLTPAGARRLQAELTNLLEVKRPPLLAAVRGDGDAKLRLQMLEQRIAYLQESLRLAEVVPPAGPGDDRVRFGATVTVREGSGEETRYRIVGVDETELDRNWVSWLSPIARALLNARLGQRVPFRFPAGQTELEIVKIEYM
jgi:transcription elongation factor GreB